MANFTKQTFRYTGIECIIIQKSINNFIVVKYTFCSMKAIRTHGQTTIPGHQRPPTVGGAFFAEGSA